MADRNAKAQLSQNPDVAAFFRDVDYVDIKGMDATTTLREFIAGMLSYYPWWIVWLYRIREIIVRLLGLVKHDQPEHLPVLHPGEISFTPGGTVSFFIVRKAREERF